MKVPALSSAWRIPLIVGVGVGAFFLVSWGIDWWTGRGQEKFKEKAVVQAQHTEAAVVVAKEKDVAHRGNVGRLETLTSGVTRSGTATPREREIIAACSEVVTSCDARHVADQAVSDSLRVELKLWQNKPAAREPRFQPYVEGLYDFMGPGPVVRIGATAKLFRSISISAAADAAMPARRVDGPRVEFRALAGIRIQF